MNDNDAKEQRLTLELLDAIEGRSDISQRHLARHMGVALGLANSYLKRCAKKGLVKVREAPANRYLYYLTPKGFVEKARLTATFLSTSLNFYRQAVDACNALYHECEKQRWDFVVLCGVSDLAEIAVMSSLDSAVEIVCAFDPNSVSPKLCGKPVVRDWHACNDADAYVLTDLADPVTTFRFLAEKVPDIERVLIPGVLGIDPKHVIGRKTKSTLITPR